MKINPKVFFRLGTGLVAALAVAAQSYLASPEAFTLIGELLGNAGLAAVVAPFVTWLMSFITGLIPESWIKPPV